MVLEVAVVVTKALKRALCLFLSVASSWVSAGTLEPDNVDLMYHKYDGGGMVIDGPSILVRKSVGNSVSLTGHYYVDTVSAASIDVVTNASEYTEERTEYSAGGDFLHDKTLMSLHFTNSTENDFEADSIHFQVSQDFFGDLTNLSLGYSQGWDTVMKRANDVFREEADRRHYRFGLSQVLTKSWIMGLNFEHITDEGFLENPYRVHRFLNPDGSEGTAPEDYPETRTSNAVSLRTQHYLPYRASVMAEYRLFRDTWGIKASNWQLKYAHAVGESIIVEANVRHYEQTKADFYADLFPRANFQTHMGRDKELATYSNNSYGLGLSYEVKRGVIPLVDRLQLGLLVDFMQFDFDDYRDRRQSKAGSAAVGQESMYSFDATVTRLSLIVEY